MQKTKQISEDKIGLNLRIGICSQKSAKMSKGKNERNESLILYTLAWDNICLIM